eukprot:gene8936-gene9712
MSAVKPIFQPVFDANWSKMSTILAKHYANRPFSKDMVTMKGEMNIKMSLLMKLASPIYRLFGSLVPYTGDNIKTTAFAKSELNSNKYIMERHFHFPGKEEFVFRSALLPIKNNEVVELMKFGVGWRAKYILTDTDCGTASPTVRIIHQGYVLHLPQIRHDLFISLPLELFIGEIYAEEVTSVEDSFNMRLSITHRLFGVMYEYSGRFAVTDVEL